MAESAMYRHDDSQVAMLLVVPSWIGNHGQDRQDKAGPGPMKFTSDLHLLQADNLASYGPSPHHGH